jgi:hypothetical protein
VAVIFRAIGVQPKPSYGSFCDDREAAPKDGPLQIRPPGIARYDLQVEI